jgi:hypothetical protein
MNFPSGRIKMTRLKRFSWADSEGMKMNEEAKMSMMLCSGLEPSEQEKVERLDGPIATGFISAGKVVRICQGRTAGGRRLLDFCGPAGTVASVLASDFLAATDEQAVAIVVR